MVRFDEYNEAEVRRIAAAFVACLDGERAHFEQHHAPTWQWTDKIVDWWSGSAPAAGVVVDAHPVSTKRGYRDAVLDRIAPPFTARYGECMLDLTHTRFETYGADYGTIEYWRRAYASTASPELLLALESESGKRGARGINTHDVLEDASKLLPVAARVKVMVFASHDSGERDVILEIARLMLAKDYTARSRPCVWAWIDLPWASWRRHPPTAWVGSTAGLQLECT